MLLYLSIFGIFLSVILMYFNTSRKTSRIYLAIFCFLISLYSANQYAIVYSESVFWVTILYTNFTFLSYFLGPVCYWYTRSILKGDIRLKKRDIWHFVPAVIQLSASMPYILTSYAHKVEIAKSIVSDPGFLGTYNATILSDIFSNTVMYISRPFLLLIYIFWSIGMFASYKYKERNSPVFSRPHFMDNWMMFFFGFQLTLVISHLLVVFRIFASEVSNLLYTPNILQALSFIGLTGLILTPFFFPRILYGVSASAPTLLPPKESESDETTIAIECGGKKTISYFDFDYMLSIVQKMTTCMQEENLYLQPDCNLAHFAVTINIPTHHLAYFFREIKKQSFNDYRNECRVNHAKKLILEGKSEELTLEAIGLISGFTNRNTFFTAFKKLEGFSPSTFVSQMDK